MNGYKSHDVCNLTLVMPLMTALNTVPELRKALTSNDPVVVDEALLLIGKRGVEELEPEVWKFLDSEDEGLRQRAVATLGGSLRAPEFRDRALMMAKADPDPFVRASAVNAWSVGYYTSSNDRQVVSTLKDIVKNDAEDGIVRVEALRGLYAVTGTPFRHVDFSRMRDLDDADKLRQMIPWHEVDAMVDSSHGRHR